MKSRKSFEFEELDDSVNLIIKTKCPSKWILVDRETGQVYQGNKSGHWDKIRPI